MVTTHPERGLARKKVCVGVYTPTHTFFREIFFLIIVVTHTIPQEWVKEGSPFTFVTDGVESAMKKARQIAGNKNIGVGGADITRQCLKLGLLDEIQIDLVPVLLGQGVRLFEYLGVEPIELERTGVVEAPGVTHLSFRIVK